MTGVNSLGESAPSIHSEARTSIITPAEMPNYKLINESNGKGKISAHILDVSHGRGAMVASPLDAGKKSALGTVDKDYGSCYQVLDWDGPNMKFTNIPDNATVRSVIKDGFTIKDGHPSFNKDWTEPVNAQQFAAELIKHNYRQGWALPPMPKA